MRALLTARDRSAPIDALYKCLLRSRAATLRAVERMDAAVLVVATACGAADGGGAAATAETRAKATAILAALAEEGDGGRAALARDPRAVPALVELCGGGGLVTSKCKEQAARALRALAREPAHLRAVGKAHNACAALVGVVADDALSARAALCAATVLMKLAHLERSHREAIAAAGGLGALITLLRAGSAEAKLVAATALGLLAEQLGGGGGGGAGGLHAAQVAELRQLMSQLARSGEPDAKAVAHACLRSLPGAAPPPAAAPAASSSWFW